MIINLNFEGTPEEFRSFIAQLCRCNEPVPQPELLRFSQIQLEFNTMGLRTIKGTQPDETGHLNLKATDLEGSQAALPADLSVVWETSDPEAIGVSSDPSAPLDVTVSFGTPNADGTPRLATLTGLITSPSTGLTGVVTENFAIVAGDAANLTIVGLEFPNLPPAENPPPVEEPTA